MSASRFPQGIASPHPSRLAWLLTAITAFFLFLLIPAAHADTKSEQEAQSILHMLDYLSVDYGGSVWFGKVLNEREYKEQLEFAGQAVILIVNLPAHPVQADLIKEAQELDRNVQAKASAELVNASAQQLQRKIIAAYKVPVSPQRIPDSRRAVVLYQQFCISCHGAEGRGDGSESKTLNPKPTNFHDATRMGQRSVYGLFSTISLGVPRTGMPAFTNLSDDERWALAFLVSNFHNLPERLDMGRRLWEKRNFQGAAPNLIALATLTANEVSVNHGDNTRAVFEYLRAEPQALVVTPHATLIFATEQLDHALARYRADDQAGALRFAIAAYLEGFEPMEIGLVNLNARLRLDIEREMMAIRQLIYGGAPSETLALKIEHAKELLGQADELLREDKLTILGAFASSVFVLLRGGFTAILILPAVIAFLVKSGQKNTLPYIHAGWGSALLMGIITGGAASWLVDISGAERETTSGVAALIASAMFIYVGFWLHDKTHARAWQKLLKDKVNFVLEKKILWALALVSFFAVYRGIFETVLFYQALWTQTSDIIRSSLWGGVITSALALMTVGWGMFRIGIRMPLDLFFPCTSILFAIMAVIFAGQGIASLQIVGIVTASPINFISLPILGVLPTTQTLIFQAAVIGILILVYLIPVWRQRNGKNDIPPASQG
jgi:high-affinity iron transporter